MITFLLMMVFLVSSIIAIIGYYERDIEFIIGGIIFSIISIYSIININQPEKDKTKLFKPEYQIELLNQNYVRIYNGETYKTIKFDSIQDYIINDNL